MMTLVVGMIIGAVLGLTGAGGSVFAVPLLINLLGFSMPQAIGLSLGAVAASALFGVILKWRSGHIEWLPAAVFAALGSIGAPLGNWLNRYVSETWLLLGFSLLVVIVAVRMWLQAGRRPEEAREVRASFSRTEDDKNAVCRMNAHRPFRIGLPCVMGMSVGALGTGFISGLFGVGGGFLIVPILLYLTDISVRQAVATSLLVIAVISSVGFGSFFVFGSTVDLLTLLWLAGGGLIGMMLGVFFSRFIAGPRLQQMFAVLMVAVLLVTLVNRF